MGSGGSKDASTASCSGGIRRLRLRGVRVFNSSSSCFGLTSILADGRQKIDVNAASRSSNGADEPQSKTAQGNEHDSEKIMLPHHDGLILPHSSNGEQCGQDNEGTLQIDFNTNSSSAVNSIGDQLSNTSGRSHSRFTFKPDGISSRLNRAVSLGSSGSHSLFSADVSVPTSDLGQNNIVNHDHVDCTQNCSIMGTNSSLDVAPLDEGIETTINRDSGGSFIESRNTRQSQRRLATQETLEGSVRFSRTLSVGRLRDRVLRRTAFSDGLFDPSSLEDRFVWPNGQIIGRRALGGTGRRDSSPRRTNDLLPDSPSNISYRASRSMDINDDNVVDAHQRRAGNHDVFEHRSAFLERRRRIRSQVRALQRLGSRFESLSGHDRSCILSGQHRTGHCTCRTSNQTSNAPDDPSSRASISRIVMLAEALFEVLDELHQQSVVLSSRPSFSSIGSVPAPKEVVECIPIKIFSKTLKWQIEEAAQCFICLVEYEEGDCMRLLPCNHEFHRTCIDKWLKEIHRVCPLCRHDVCTSDAPNKQKFS
ncbi:uncharacterized protein LOC121985130 [Zingiber officinale]|uniref:RING-type domain-containing protein n=1 Tax=Zingiber officinale TaxID=94328 RepID=A0A8J5I2U8_ZINOF|nr:uncharacterized protein LOC121985130 [Zingiber officinale]KAG6534264.1 hypothetical protein ZIOFF_008150 [Zingiber officinale]